MAKPLELDMAGVQGGPTPAQSELIDSICTTLGIDFYGITRRSASKFIDEHIDDYYDAKEVER